jgi:hypothetical protein
MHVVTGPASQDVVIKFENYNSPKVVKFKNFNSPLYTCMLSLGPLRRMQFSNSRIILSDIHMHIVTAPASQDADIKFENFNSPIYTCMLSLGSLRRKQLSNSRILTLRYTHACCHCARFAGCSYQIQEL